MAASADKLAPRSYVILGMLGLGLRSGYEIKRAVDGSSRHFLALSFQQIYPELHRLKELGLVSASDADTGDRRRVFYELTGDGRTALEEWLRKPEELVVELRHSGLAKLMFADHVGVEDQVALLDQIRAHHEETAAALEVVRDASTAAGDRCLLMTIDFGIELFRFITDWCERTAAALQAEDAAAA